MTLEYHTPNPLSKRHLLSRAICWLVILGVVGMIVIRVNFGASGAVTKSHASSETDNVILQMSARMAVGTHAIQSELSSKSKTDPAALMHAIDAAAHSPRDKICAATVAGEIMGREEALSRLKQVDPRESASLADDLSIFNKIYTDGAASIDADQRATLLSRYGWYGKLALAFDSPSNEAAHESVVAPARKSVVIFTIAGLLFIIVALAGVILLIVGGALFMANKIHTMFVQIPTTAVGAPPVFLEAFAIYLVGITLFGEFLSRVVHAHSYAWYFVSLALIPIVLIWPVLRGMNWQDVRTAFGYVAPRGAFREPFMGIVGYIAALPILAIALWISSQLSRFAGISPTHPIINELRGSASHIVMLYLLASVWAPIMEETMFRGAFYSHLRGNWNYVVSSIVVGIFFAAIHPQGWTFIPVLGGIGMVLCWIREWRGSILASMAAHALNNAVVLTLALIALR